MDKQIFTRIDPVSFERLQVIAKSKGIKLGVFTRMLLLEKLKEKDYARS